MNVKKLYLHDYEIVKIAYANMDERIVCSNPTIMRLKQVFENFDVEKVEDGYRFNTDHGVVFFTKDSILITDSRGIAFRIESKADYEVFL